MKTQLISPTLRWIANDIITAAEPSMSPQKALKTLLQNPNWEEEIKKYFKQKQAGMTKAIPLALAILTLSQQTGAATADELISKVKEKAKQTQVKQESITQADIDKMKDIIPFPVSETELKTLKTGAVPFFMFKGAFQRKIKKSLDNEVMPAVDKDPKFSKLSADELTKLIFKGFMAKLNDPKYKEAQSVLKEYLKGDMGKIEDLARATLKKEVAVALR